VGEDSTSLHTADAGLLSGLDARITAEESGRLQAGGKALQRLIRCNVSDFSVSLTIVGFTTTAPPFHHRTPPFVHCKLPLLRDDPDPCCMLIVTVLLWLPMHSYCKNIRTNKIAYEQTKLTTTPFSPFSRLHYAFASELQLRCANWPATVQPWNRVKARPTQPSKLWTRSSGRLMLRPMRQRVVRTSC
jgi:hypothetical protein